MKRILMKNIILATLIGTALAIAAPTPALCKSQPSMARADFFSEGTSARAFGIGGAFASMADDAGAAYWNPAGLLLMDRGQFHTTHSTKNEFGLTTQSLCLAMPAFSGMAAMNFVYTSSADVLLTTENAITGRLEPAGTLDESDSAGSFSYAWQPKKYLFAGASLKKARQKIGSAKDEGWGMDLGAIYQFDHATRVSVAIQNVGDMSIGADEAPMNPRIGVARKFDRDRLTLGAAFDFNYFNEEVFSVGGEYAIEETFFARMGTTGPKYSAGVGFNYEQFNVDYAFMTDKNSGDEQKLSITYMINSTRKRMPSRAFKTRRAASVASGEPVILKPKRKEKPEEAQKPKEKEQPSGELKLKETKKEKTETAPEAAEEKTDSEKPAEKKSAKKSSGKSSSKSEKTVDKASSSKSRGKEKSEDEPEKDKSAKSEKASPSIEWEKPVETKTEPAKKEYPAAKLKSSKTIPAGSRTGAEDPYGEIPTTGEYRDPLSMPFNEYGAMSGVEVEELPMAIPDESATGSEKLDVPVDLNKNWWPEPMEENEGQFGLDPE